MELLILKAWNGVFYKPYSGRYIRPRRIALSTKFSFFYLKKPALQSARRSLNFHGILPSSLFATLSSSMPINLGLPLQQFSMSWRICHIPDYPPVFVNAFYEICEIWCLSIIDRWKWLPHDNASLPCSLPTVCWKPN